MVLSSWPPWRSAVPPEPCARPSPECAQSLREGLSVSEPPRFLVEWALPQLCTFRWESPGRAPAPPLSCPLLLPVLCSLLPPTSLTDGERPGAPQPRVGRVLGTGPGGLTWRFEFFLSLVVVAQSYFRGSTSLRNFKVQFPRNRV